MASDSYYLLLARLRLLDLLVDECDKRHLFDINTDCEDFFTRMYNLCDEYSFENLNPLSMNAIGVDLIDRTHKIIVQVSSVNTKKKIKESLAKSQDYKGYHFIYHGIGNKSVKSLRKKQYETVGELVFNPSEDIRDREYFINYFQLMREKVDEGNVLLEAFFPWISKLFLNEENALQKAQDKKLLTEFFSYFSTTLMDNFIDDPSWLSYKLNASWGIWGEGFHMRFTYFCDEILRSRINRFWANWDGLLTKFQNDYHPTTNPNMHKFLKKRGNVYDNSRYELLLEKIPALRQSYDELIEYVKSEYQLDLYSLSIDFESSFSS